jgi:hypothetical protein
LSRDGSRAFFGEYGDGMEKSEVCLYVSEDRGQTWEPGFHFPKGSIRHIHNLLIDPYEDCYWVLVGDYDDQPGIGRLSRDLKNLDWLIRGTQEARAVSALITADSLSYGTDSDFERNFIVRLDKRSGKLERLCEIEGSSLYAVEFGPVKAISTCVERNPACPSRDCTLYVSPDGDSWSRVLSHRKDFFNPKIFQFGCLVLPYSHCPLPRGMYSGQAVEEAHNRVTMLDFE